MNEMLRAAALLIFGFAAAMSSAGAQSPPVIEATAVTVGGAYSDVASPDAAIWARIPESTIELRLAPPVHESIVLLQAASGQASGMLPLRVAVIVDRRRIHFRLRWKDVTLDGRRTMNEFADAAAVEIPQAARETSPIMGTLDSPVSIWRWSAASNDAEALIAGGPGTLTRATSTGLLAKGVYKAAKDPEKNEWLVVISQELDDSADGKASLRSRKSFPAAFAVWQGSDRQRGGFKRVSGWITVAMPTGRKTGR